MWPEVKKFLRTLLLIAAGFALGHDVALTNLATDMKIGRLIERSNGLLMQIRARRFWNGGPYGP